MSHERIAETPAPDEYFLRGLFTEGQQRVLARTLWLNLVRTSELSPTNRLVAVMLWTHVGANGAAWVGQETLAHETGYGIRTVRRAVDDLEVGAWIERQRVSRRKAMTTHLCWPNDDQVAWPRPATVASLETGHRGTSPAPETGHSRPSPATHAARPATHDSETGHTTPRRSSEGGEDGGDEKDVDDVADFDLATLLDSIPGRRHRHAS